MMIFVIFIILIIPLGFKSDAKSISVGIDKDFSSIQSAIDFAEVNDTIFVSCGIYNESIQLLKPLRVFGEIGCTILTHSNSSDIISIAADNCTISGFIIQNCTNQSYSGINILSDGNTISDNIFRNNQGWGLYVYHSEKNSIINNSFENDGICVVGSLDEWSSIQVSGNSVLGNPIKWIVNEKDLHIENETIGQLILVNSSNCTIQNVTVNRTDQGIVLAYSNNCTLIDNQVSDCRFGVRLQYAHSNLLVNNFCKENEYGLYITHSEMNEIVNNTMIANTVYGCFFCCNSKGNVLTMNSFIDNQKPAYDYFDNIWSKQGIGNYFSEYQGMDENNDGIGDIPFQIPPDFGDNIDPFPIMNFSKIRQKPSDESPGFFLTMFIFSIVIIYLARNGKKKER